MNSYNWPHFFRAIYDKALKQYQQGNRKPESYFTDEETAGLASMGCRPVEVYDFAEDYPEIEWETALLITSVRRSHFLSAEGAPDWDYRLKMEDFPAKDAVLKGIPWLPRLIAKANARLRGQLPAELMYCCGGDRAFFRKYDIDPADFLRLAWYAGDDHCKIVEFVTSRAPEGCAA